LTPERSPIEERPITAAEIFGIKPDDTPSGTPHEEGGVTPIIKEHEEEPLSSLPAEEVGVQGAPEVTVNYPEPEQIEEEPYPSDIPQVQVDRIPPHLPALSGCRYFPIPLFEKNIRNVDNYLKLNRVEEGTYGVVYRAQDKQTGEIVALKKLKMDREKEGFPITSLRFRSRCKN